MRRITAKVAVALVAGHRRSDSSSAFQTTASITDMSVLTAHQPVLDVLFAPATLAPKAHNQPP